MSEDFTEFQTMNCEHVKAGDTVTRMLSGTIPVAMIVTQVDEDKIYIGDPGEGWEFDRKTGVEIDERFGWGPDTGRTGSFLMP